MTFLKRMGDLFLLPGTLVLQSMGVSVEDDGGLFRSFINMCFWGVVVVAVALISFV